MAHKRGHFLKRIHLQAWLILICLFFVGCTELSAAEMPEAGSAKMSERHEEKLWQIEVAAAFYNTLSDALDKEKFQCIFSSTDKIFRDLTEGLVCMAAATQGNPSQESLLEDSEYSFEYYELFESPVVIFVNKDNPITDISLKELENAYLYDRKWCEISEEGDNKSIVTYRLTDENGSQTCMKKAFDNYTGNYPEDENHRISYNMNSIIEDVEKDPEGLAYAFYEFYKDHHNDGESRIITVDGKEYREAGYPLTFKVYLIVNPELMDRGLFFRS